MTCGYFSVSAVRSWVRPASADHLAEDVVQLLRREQHAEVRREFVGIARHAGGGGELDDPLAREAIELRLQQRGEDFAHPVGAEVEAQDAVAVLHAFVVADDGGHDELVGHVVRVGVLHHLHRIVEMGAVGFGERGIGLGDAVPALVAVHRVVAADDGADRDRIGQVPRATA